MTLKNLERTPYTKIKNVCMILIWYTISQSKAYLYWFVLYLNGRIEWPISKTHWIPMYMFIFTIDFIELVDRKSFNITPKYNFNCGQIHKMPLLFHFKVCGSFGLYEIYVDVFRIVNILANPKYVCECKCELGCHTNMRCPANLINGNVNGYSHVWILSYPDCIYWWPC